MTGFPVGVTLVFGGKYFWAFSCFMMAGTVSLRDVFLSLVGSFLLGGSPRPVASGALEVLSGCLVTVTGVARGGAPAWGRRLSPPGVVSEAAGIRSVTGAGGLSGFRNGGSCDAGHPGSVVGSIGDGAAGGEFLSW